MCSDGVGCKALTGITGETHCFVAGTFVSTEDVSLPTDIKARSFLPDGTELTTDMTRVVVKQDGSIRTTFPYNSMHKTN